MIFDLHNDLLWEALASDQKHNYLDNNCDNRIVCALWTTTKRDDVTKSIESTIREFSRHSNTLFAIEDLHFVTEGNIAQITKLPLIYCTLAWQYNNSVAGGHNDDGGVTEWGEKIIFALNQNRIAVDTAHLNEKSFYNVLDCAEFVLNSHTCQSHFNAHTRNISDEQISQLIKRDGIVAISTVGMHLSKGCACRNDVLVQILRFIDKFGENNLCIGTDFFGAPPLKGLNEYQHFALLQNELEFYGCTKETIDKIFFLNAENFYNKLRYGE